MSYTTIFAFKGGELMGTYEFQNSCGSAVAIWNCAHDRHFPGRTFSLSMNLEPLWRLAEDAEVPWFARVALTTTFDHVAFRRDDILTVARALDLFTDHYAKEWVLEGKSYSLAKQADALRGAYANGADLVGWNQTSVNGDCIFEGVYDDDKDEMVPFDPNGTAHWVANIDYAKEV